MADRKCKAKKTAQKSSVVGSISSSVLCPICRTILTEPVTLPCNHVFCKPCFEGSMENASLVCPLCRIRVGSWYRKSKKEGKIVDEVLWSTIQGQYPFEVRNKLHGIDNDMEKDKPVIVVASPGEIRREYEKERLKHMEEQKRLREAEEKASAMLIKKLKEEEELRKQMEEKKLKLDALLAKKLADELNEPSTSKNTPRRVMKKSATLDRFLHSEDKSLSSLNKNRLALSPCRSRKNNLKISSSAQFAIKSNSSLVRPAKKLQTSSSSHSFKTCFVKEFPCQALSSEPSPRNVRRESNLFADLDFRGFLGKMESRRKVEKAKSDQDQTSERDSCISGYKSSGSGDNSDVIDQECKFYFKPINIEKRYHLPWKPPLRLHTVWSNNDDNIPIRPPSGTFPYLSRGASAFARFLKDEEEFRSNASSTSELEMERISNSSRRSLSPEIRSSATKRLRVSSVGSSPFYGFNRSKTTDIPQILNQIIRRVDASPLYGFDVLQISESSERHDKLSKNVERLGEASTHESIKETDINKNLCNNKDIGLTVSAVGSSGVFSGTSFLSKQKNPPKSTRVLLESPLSLFDSDSDENLHNLINSICDQSWENSPRTPKNGLKNCTKAETVTSDSLAVIEIRKLQSDEKCLSSKSSPKVSVDLEAVRKQQEEADFEYAKKLQAQFDLIGTTSRTRRGTERQITLDEMLSSA